jgi:hypothetical protein
VATLPVKRSANDQILTFLIDLRARFRRWLHQDEFGPTRRQQAAALRALKKSLQTLQRHLAKGARSQREQLDVMLRSGSENSTTTLERIYEAAVDLGRYLRISDASNRKIEWALKIHTCVETIMAQSQALDTNADGELLLIALRQNFDPLQACPADFGLAGAEQWLHSYWKVVDEALCALNERGGAEERVSLKLVVQELCKLWEGETGRAVTAHGMTKLEYTQRTETDAGRFVTAAVEAILPERAWFDDHSQFSGSVRAMTFLASHSPDRARQILVIMRDFVRRAERSKKTPLHKKLAFNSVNAGSAPPPVAYQENEKPRTTIPPPRPDVDRAETPSLPHRGRVND